MITSIPPKEQPGFCLTGRYGVTQTAKILGVRTMTIYRWEAKATRGTRLKRHTHKETHRDYFLGSDIQAFWEASV